jgi:hypothetical protein
VRIACLAFLLVGSPVRAESLDALLSRVAKAYGPGTFRVVRESGTLESPRGVAQTLRLFAPPDRLRVEIRYPDSHFEIRVLAGPHAWRDGRPVEGPPRDAMLLQAARLDLPALVLRNRSRLVDLGPLTGGLRGIGVPLDGGLQLAVSVDPKTAHIVHSEGQLPGPLRFATDYRDFRRVNGVLFAFGESNFASGQKTGETTLTKIEVLDEAPPGSFAP